MPTYEYRCTQCGNEFDLFQKMSDPPHAECPSCGGSAERKLSAGAGLLFKGSGFYITDYRSDSYKKAAGSEGGKPEAGAKKADGGAKKADGGKPVDGGSGGSGSSAPASSDK